MKKFIQLVVRKLGRLGPGFITGAADDDPSGIATYSIAGAQFGYKLNWLSFFLTPLMYSIQEMCGRIGMVSGVGLAGAMRKYYSKRILIFSITLLAIANTVNIGADLGIMAAALQMILGLPFIFWLMLVTVFTILMEVLIPYNRYARYLKWMAFTLLAYGLTVLLTKQDWPSVLKFTLIPHIDFNLSYLMTMVGFLGTTISPYLFFWQAAEEVEEAIKEGKIAEFDESPEVVEHEIRHMKKDTGVGMFFSNLVAAFVVLTTAATLHQNGITDIETPQQVAMALKPLAGDLSYLLFTFGIIGIGLQSVPILAGGVAYSFAEAFGFKEGLAKKFTEAKAFYSTIALATILGAIMNLIGINPIKTLFYTAVLNGIIAIPLIFIIIKMSDDKRIVKNFISSRKSRVLGWLTFFLMLISVILMVYYLIRTH